MSAVERINAIIQPAIRDVPAGSRGLIYLTLGGLFDLDEETKKVLESLTRFRVEIRRLTAHVQCMTCFGEYFPVRRQLKCPFCGGVGAKIISGEECYVERIELNP